MIRASNVGHLLGLGLTALASVGMWLGLAPVLSAQTIRPANENPGPTALTPFPESDIYRVQVFGDAFADGLTAGLVDVMAANGRVQVQRKHKAIGSLIRTDWEDEIRLEEVSREVVHIGVLMLGLQDRQAIRVAPGMRPFAIGSDDWREEYGQRLDRVIKGLRKRGMVLYVVGQPVLRQPNANSQAEMLNEVMRQRAAAGGAKFIDIYDAFQEDGGGFTQFGPDVSGNRVKLREGDGITFTGVGNKQLAFFVDKEIKRDIEQAVSDRAIPLAGDETEQRKLNPAKQAVAAGQPANWKGSVTFGQTKGAQPQVPVAPSSADASGDQKSDNSKVVVRAIAANGREETVTLEILRPAIPAAVIALVTRREAGADKSAQPGEAVVEEIGGGLTVVNSVSMLGDGLTSGGAGGRRKVSPTQSAFYTVLVKGERPTPKPGRADDFTWPRNDSVLSEPATATAPTGAPRINPATGQPNVRPGLGAPKATPGQLPAAQKTAPRP